MRRPARAAVGALALVTVLGTPGCGLRNGLGSTTAQAGGPADATGLQSSEAGGTASGVLAGTAADATSGTAATSQSSSVGGPVGTVDGTTPGTAVGPATGTGTTGSTVRATGTIEVGFQVAINTQAAFAATGATSDPADEEHMVKALVAWVNATGGINGRKLVAVIHPTDPTSGSFASQAAAACADFTQDHHVVAIASTPVNSTDDLLRCAAKAGVPEIDQSLWSFDDEYYRQYPGLLYQPGRASSTRWPQATVDGLDAAGYFANGAKVGILSFDAPVYTRVVTRLRAEMKRRGHAFTTEVSVATPPSVSDFGAMSAAIGNAILKFRQDGVDHVMFAASAELPFFFMAQAESQQYRPRYGLSSNDGPDTQINIGAPDAQLRGALAVGWLTATDVGDDQPGNKSATVKLCESIMAKYGAQASGFYSDSHCDSMFFLRRVLERAAGTSVRAMQAAAASLGTTYLSPLTMATSFRRGFGDGASRWRLAAYSSDCTCFRYSGPERPL
jgi:ABC-type branched-subunit amino acid transport system substrate-binding protein